MGFMKTIEDIRLAIDKTINDLSITKSRRASRIEFLRKCEMYLETNPRPEFLAKMLLRSQLRASVLQRQANDEMPSERILFGSKRTAELNKKLKANGYFKVKHQIELMEFLLENVSA